jgi:hypothetical protein
MSELAARLRSLLLQMLVAVFVLHGAAIAVYMLTPLRHSSGSARTAFMAVWTVATLVVVLSGLHRIRAARAAGRRAAPAPR